MKWVTAYSMKDVCIVPDVVLIRAGIGRLLTASLRHSEWSISGQRRILCREELRPATKSTYGSLPADAAASNRYNHYAVPRMAILSFPRQTSAQLRLAQMPGKDGFKRSDRSAQGRSGTGGETSNGEWPPSRHEGERRK
jgi:hypothetical protein